MNEEDVREYNLRRLREQQRLEEVKEATFAPVLNPRTLKLVNRIKARRRKNVPMTQILEQREFERALKIAEKDIQDDDELETAPKITQQAAKMVRDGSITDRLYEMSFKLNDMHEEKLQHSASIMQNLYDFSPRLHNTRGRDEVSREDKRRRSSSEDSKLNIPIHEELLNRGERIRLRKNQRMEELLEKQKSMRHPKINAVSEEIASRLPINSQQRLWGQSASPKAQKKDLSQYTFKPAINQKSVEIDHGKKGIPQPDVHARIDSMYQKEEKRKEKLKNLRQELEEKELEGCTFSPNTQREPIAWSPSFTQRVSQWDRKRRAKVARERAVVAQKELANCTFSPNIDRMKKGLNTSQSSIKTEDLYSPKKGTDPLGFEEFVQRQVEARERRESLKKGIFATGENWKNEITVPKEFQLGQKNDIRVKSLKRPISPHEAKKNKNLSPERGRPDNDSDSDLELDDLRDENEYINNSDDEDSDTIVTPKRQNLFEDDDYSGSPVSLGAGFNREETSPPDVPPQGLFSSKTTVSILEKFSHTDSRLFTPSDTNNSRGSLLRSRQNLEGGLLLNESLGKYSTSAPSEEWKRRAYLKDDENAASSPKKWKEEHAMKVK